MFGRLTSLWLLFAELTENVLVGLSDEVPAQKAPVIFVKTGFCLFPTDALISAPNILT